MRITRLHYMADQEAATSWVDAKLREVLGEFGDRVTDISRTRDGNKLKFSFRVARLAHFKGTLLVTQDCIHLDLPFPLVARFREGAARAVVEKWLDENLPLTRARRLGD